MNGSTFTHGERSVSDRLGLDLKKLRAVRSASLTRGADWQQVAGEVRYSESGLDRISASLGATPPEYSAPKKLPDSAPAELATPRTALVTLLDHRLANLVTCGTTCTSARREPPPANPEPGALHELLVLRVYTRNHRIVLAQFGDQEARIRVRDNSKLAPGMTVQCSYVERDLWDIAQRLPRWKGKW